MTESFANIDSMNLSNEALAFLVQVGFYLDPLRTDVDYFIAMTDTVAEEDIRLAYLRDDLEAAIKQGKDVSSEFAEYERRSHLCDEIFNALAKLD